MSICSLSVVVLLLYRSFYVSSLLLLVAIEFFFFSFFLFSVGSFNFIFIHHFMKFYARITLFNAHIGVVLVENENTTKNNPILQTKS